MTAVALGGHRVRVVVAGTTGGVGTTTVAAIAWDALRVDPAGAPALYDHSGGDVGARLPAGDEVSRIDPVVAVHDLGPHAVGPGLAALAGPHDLLVAVTDAGDYGIGLGRTLLESARERFGIAGLRRTLLVVTGSQGVQPAPRELEALKAGFERTQVLALRSDAALAPGGRVPLARLRRPTARQAHDLGRRVADLVGRHRG